MDLRDYIRAIPDFPRPGILFRDITPLLKDPAAFHHAIGQLGERISHLEVDAVVGIEARGFLFAAPLAHHLGKALIPVKKASGRARLTRPPTRWSTARMLSRCTGTPSCPGSES